MGGSWIVTDSFATRTSPQTCVSGAAPARPSVTLRLLGVLRAQEQDGAGEGDIGVGQPGSVAAKSLMTDGEQEEKGEET